MKYFLKIHIAIKICMLFVVIQFFVMQWAYAGDKKEIDSGIKNFFIIGIGTHFAGGKRLIDASLDLIAHAAINAIRDDVTWARVEQKKGVLEVPEWWDHYVDKALQLNIQPLLVLCYGNRFYGDGGKLTNEDEIEAFTQYAHFIVAHFKDRVFRYEIWNEWDGRCGHTRPGKPEEYVQLVRMVYPAIKSIDPEVEVIVGAATTRGIRNGFIKRILELGVMKYADALSLHTYNHSSSDSTPEAWAAWMRKVEQELMDANSGKPLPFYITEMGWPTHTGSNGVIREVQAEYLARLFLLARTLPFIKGIWWYDLQNDGEDPHNQEHNFGIVRHDLTPKPAYYALSTIARDLPRLRFIKEIPVKDRKIKCLRFKRPFGEDMWAVWSVDHLTESRFCLQTQEPADIKIQLIGKPAIPAAWSKTGSGFQKSKQLCLTVGGMPWLISGDLEDVSIAETK